jgi:glycosyltransferase involved in cell wall biosynthesis
MKVAVVGSRGIPASYGGFETSIEETAVRFVRQGIDTTVYCRSRHFKKRMPHYKGVRLVYLPSIKTKQLDTITHTFLSVMHSIFRGYDVIMLFGVGNSLFIPFYRILGRQVISIVDGADWERRKWGRFARWFLRSSRFFSVRFSNYYIVDNEALAKEYASRFKRPGVYIPYGADENVPYSPDVLKKFRLKEKDYIIFVGRFVKEKGIDFLIESFEKIKTDKKLVIVGGNDIDKEYEQYLKNTKDGRIIFTGFLYGNDYESLLRSALFYVSCSYLEGTSPSLLNAMAVNGFAVVSDIEENCEVLKGTCVTFKTGDSVDFVDKITYYLHNPDIVENERYRTREIVNIHYDWEKIARKYIELFENIQNQKKQKDSKTKDN